MKLNFFVRRRILKKTNALDLIPIRRCKHQMEENGKATILVPKFKNEKIAKFMLGKRSNFIQIHLDENGTAVWLEIDGMKDIRSIIDSLKLRLGEEFPQVAQRTNKFMSRLYDERYITFRQLEEAVQRK